MQGNWTPDRLHCYKISQTHPIIISLFTMPLLSSSEENIRFQTFLLLPCSLLSLTHLNLSVLSSLANKMVYYLDNDYQNKLFKMHKDQLILVLFLSLLLPKEVIYTSVCNAYGKFLRRDFAPFPLKKQTMKNSKQLRESLDSNPSTKFVPSCYDSVCHTNHYHIFQP